MHVNHTLGDPTALHQDRILKICSAGPSGALADLVREGAAQDRPAWFVDDVVLPRLTWVHEYGRKPDDLDPAVYAAIATGAPENVEQVLEKPGRQKKMKHLAAAALLDVLGMSEQDAAERLGYTVDEPRHWADSDGSRGVRDAAALGRPILAQLGAWPWWGSAWWYERKAGQALKAGEALPRDWWKLEATAASLFMWRYGRPFRAWRNARASRA
jgi:hypothetical protein